MKERAYAKINLCLDVLKGRQDGYHELRMIMVPVDFYDVLEMERDTQTSISLNRSYLPVNEKNTVLKAVQVMQQDYGLQGSYRFTLTKHIPTQAGLAGGSADAAAAIRMLNQAENLNLSRAELLACGRKVGSDVPFCIFNEPALVEGTGEVIEPFVCKTEFEVLLVKPRRGVSTKAAFAALDETTYEHPDVEGMRRALMENDYLGVLENLGNALEEVSMQLVPKIRDVKEQLLELGFEGALMSGSGSTVFGITRNHALINRAADLEHSRGYFTRKTRILTRGKGWAADILPPER